jgi:UDP:flavonoid glycosyltransferase YjiC (YdhE family)
VRALIDRGKRVLVQASADIANDYPAEQVRYERWVSQSQVLSHDAVEFLVTHSGSGAVQEAIWFGQPMLCVPHAWDQYYYGWIVQNLGVGEVIAKRRLRFPA